MRDGRDGRDSKFEVLGSKFRKPRTSNLKPSSVVPIAFFSQVSRITRHAGTVRQTQRHMVTYEL